MRWLLPILLVGVGIAGYFLVTKPMYDEALVMKEEADAYATALDNSANLQKERDRLTTKYNSFAAADLERLETMLPNSVDNIQLILEIQEEASKRGIIVKNVEFEPEQFLEEEETVPAGNGVAVAPADAEAAASRTINSRRAVSAEDAADFEEFELEFSVEGSYDNFVSFMKLMERSLRLVDIRSIAFTPGTSEKDKIYTDDYKYLFRITTYRLKD